MSTGNLPDSDFSAERQPLITAGPSKSQPKKYSDAIQGPASGIGTVAIPIDDGNQENIIVATNDASSANANREEADFPKEFHKTITVTIFCAVTFFLNTVALVLTHQRLPERDPLPDIILDNIKGITWDYGLEVAEMIIMLSMASTMVLMFLHKFRWIVFRRIFFIIGILYLMRCVTMYVTVLPVASYTYYCSPKFNQTTVLNVLEAALKVSSGFGLSIAGEHTYCGDYIYSGHTVILVTAFLVVQEYAPGHSWKWKALHWFYWTLSLVGICLVVIARGHYTVDILIGYYVTTRVFWMYHTLANYPTLKEYAATNFLGRLWWYPIFQWLEGNVNGKLPHHYTIPFLKQYSIYKEPDPLPQSTSAPSSVNENAQLQREKSSDKLTRSISNPEYNQFDETEN